MWQGGTAAARSREEAEKEKKVVACWPLPPLGPVVLTTYKKGEVQGFRRKRVSTGDNKGTCIETKNLVQMKWIKQLHSVQRMWKKRSRISSLSRSRRRQMKRKEEAWGVSEASRNLSNKDTNREQGSGRKQGIG